MKRILLLTVLYAAFIHINAQNQPIYNVPCPEVANLGMYGQVPVSYYTGIPDISVPLHEIKVGNFSMPITASYHIGSVKPNQTPGPLGLGWSLKIGGYIVRTVRGIYDEKMDVKKKEYGFYGNYSKMKNITTAQFDLYNANSGLGTDNLFELAADEFSFSFCGYEGNFYMNENGGWTVVSEQDIKVEFDPSTGFATMDQLKKAKRLTPGHWEAAHFNQRYFIKFTLITPDGTRYEFGGINATEFCIPYYYRNNSDLIATSWRLSKIITPERHVITLDYDATSRTCDIEYKPLKRIRQSIAPAENPIHKVGRSGLTGFLFFPVNIKSITTPNETIDFTYNRDWGYGRRYVYNDAGIQNGYNALYWIDENFENLHYSRGNIYSLNEELYDPANHFLLFTNVKEKESAAETTNAIADSMTYYVLHRMAIRSKNGYSAKSIYFDYVNNNRKKLSLISMMDNIPELRKDVVWHPHGYFFITGYLLPSGDGGQKVPPKKIEYRFKYNQEKKFHREFIRSKTDTWGFWNGQDIKFSGDLDFHVIGPNLEAAKAEILTEMIYPTGGRSLFEYELNSYSKLVDSLHTGMVNHSGHAGGLRIKSITNRDRENRFTSKKRYYYTANRKDTTILNSSGICKGLPIFYTKIQSESPVIEQWTTGGLYSPVTNMNSPDVGYTYVIEESQDSIGKSLGNIRYSFSNYDADINGNTHLDLACYYTQNPMNENIPGLSPYTSISFERGKLLSKEYRDHNDNVYKKEVYNYKRTPHTPLLTAYQYMIFFGFDEFYYQYKYATLGWLTHTHTASYLPVSVTETIRSTTGQTVAYTTRTYEYNSHKMLKRETCSMSDGTQEVTAYKYPFDYTKYNWMTNANITEPVIEKELTAGGLTRTETTNYASTNNGIPYIQKRTVKQGSSIKTDFEVSQVDDYGNPTEMTVNGISNILYWGHQGQRLLARVENATFTQLKYLLDFGTHATTVDYNKLINGRSLLPSALFYIYHYDSNLRLQSETTPNGMTTFYKYDNFGRLNESYYIDGTSNKKILLKSFGYQYYNQ